MSEPEEDSTSEPEEEHKSEGDGNGCVHMLVFLLIYIIYVLVH
jgi:hypothetical protein